MIGFDTNILLRLFETEEDPAQATAAQRALKEHAPVFINPVVLVEFVWTLRRTFKLDRAGIHARLAKVVNSTEFPGDVSTANTKCVGIIRRWPGGFCRLLRGRAEPCFGL